jgi:hypothetical protein
MKKKLMIAVVFGLSWRSFAENWRPPVFKPNDTVTFKETLVSKSSIAMSGKGLGYQLPPGSETSSTQSTSRTVDFLAFDVSGSPTHFAIKYDSNDADNVNVLAGRVVEINADSGAVKVVAKDGKVLSDVQRKSATTDAQEVIASLEAFGQFASLQAAPVGAQKVSTRVVAGLLGLSMDQIKEASIKCAPDHNCELQAVILEGKDQGGGEVKMSGTMNVNQDWSTIDAHLDNKSTQTSTSGDMSVTIETTWSLVLSRKIEKQ